MDDLEVKMIYKNRDRISALERENSNMDGKLNVIIALNIPIAIAVVAATLTLIF